MHELHPELTQAMSELMDKLDAVPRAPAATQVSR